VSQAEISNRERSNKALPQILCERTQTLRSLPSFLREEVFRFGRKPDWRSSPRFNRKPPFANLPRPGEGCGCGKKNCKLKPTRDGDWSEIGHLWVFQAGICFRLVYLDEQGNKVPSPARIRRDEVPHETCSQCGRSRRLARKWSSRLKRTLYIRHCYRRKDDPASLKHDPSTRYWKVDGRIEKLPAEGEERLRSGFPFPRPTCSKRGCPGLGNAMRKVGYRHHKILACRCPGPPAHIEHRVLPGGEEVKAVGFGHYRWTDAKTGRQREIKPRGARLLYRRPTRKHTCPEHGIELLQDTGPWISRRSGKTIWGLKCPTGGEVYSAEHTGELKKRRERWRRRGRPRKLAPETEDRIRKAAAFVVRGWSQRKMSPYLYPKAPASSYENTRNFFHDHRALIEFEMKRLTSHKAQAIVQTLVNTTELL